MKKRVCRLCLMLFVFSLLLIFSTVSLAFQSHYQVGASVGIYQPSFSRFNNEFDPVLHLEGGIVPGLYLGYCFTPRTSIRISAEIFHTESPYVLGRIGIEATILSLVGVVNLLEFDNTKLYIGAGGVTRKVDTEQVPMAFEPSTESYDRYSHYGFGPIGQKVLIGLSVRLSDLLNFKVEIHYVTGASGEIYGIPLDWNGFEYLIYLGSN